MIDVKVTLIIVPAQFRGSFADKGNESSSTPTHLLMPRPYLCQGLCGNTKLQTCKARKVSPEPKTSGEKGCHRGELYKIGSWCIASEMQGVVRSKLLL